MPLSGYQVAEVASEIAYDLMRDHFDTILALLDRPLPRDEVIRRLGSESVLERLVAHGLVKVEGSSLRAVSDEYRQLRQEGMISFLQRYVLPSLAASIQGDCAGMLANKQLALTRKAMRELRWGRAQTLLDNLLEISDRRADGDVYRLSVLVIGTSRVVSNRRGEAQDALVHLKQACLQRASQQERDEAVLLQFDCLADLSRYLLAERAVRDFLQSFESEQAGSALETSYHMTVASHWRCANARMGDVTGTRTQPC